MVGIGSPPPLLLTEKQGWEILSITKKKRRKKTKPQHSSKSVSPHALLLPPKERSIRVAVFPPQCSSGGSIGVAVLPLQCSSGGSQRHGATTITLLTACDDWTLKKKKKNANYHRPQYEDAANSD